MQVKSVGPGLSLLRLFSPNETLKSKTFGGDNLLNPFPQRICFKDMSTEQKCKNVQYNPYKNNLSVNHN